MSAARPEREPASVILGDQRYVLDRLGPRSRCRAVVFLRGPNNTVPYFADATPDGYVLKYAAGGIGHLDVAIGLPLLHLPTVVELLRTELRHTPGNTLTPLYLGVYEQLERHQRLVALELLARDYDGNVDDLVAAVRAAHQPSASSS
jgi:hypothetical protein